MVQDLATARAFLDELHDDPDSPINTGRLVVIGAGEGATLGALWLNAEYRRFAIRGMPLGIPLKPEENPELQHVAAAAWLSLAPMLGRRTVPLAEWLKNAGRYGEVPMAFLHGAGDEAGAGRCKDFVKVIKDNPAFQPLTGVRPVPGTAAAATQLLQPDLDTEKMIVGYVEEALKAREARKGRDPGWVARNYLGSSFVWIFSGAGQTVAKQAGLRNILAIPLDRLGIHPNGL
jgi:hypothetical protein